MGGGRVKGVAWRGVASQPTKVSFRSNKNRWITETVDGASYRTVVAPCCSIFGNRGGDVGMRSVPFFTPLPIPRSPIRLCLHVQQFCTLLVKVELLEWLSKYGKYVYWSRNIWCRVRLVVWMIAWNCHVEDVDKMSLEVVTMAVFYINDQYFLEESVFQGLPDGWLNLCQGNLYEKAPFRVILEAKRLTSHKGLTTPRERPTLTEGGGSTADTGSPVSKFPAAFEQVATLGRRSPDELEEPSNRCLFPIYWLPNPDTAALLLACNSNLRHLDVAETDQTISSLVYFTAVLRHDQGTNETLQILDLSRPLGPHMHSFDSAHFAESLGQMLRYNTCLTELHLQKMNFSDHDIELLVLGLVYNRSLLLLDLCCNNIADDGTAHLGSYLKLGPPLRGLMLSHNRITDGGARTVNDDPQYVFAFLDGLVCCLLLTVVCSTAVFQDVKVCSATRQAPMQPVVHACWNSFVIPFLSFTTPYSKLYLLDIAHNELTDVGILDILNSIKKAYPLGILYVWGNSITRTSCKIIRRMLLSKVLQQEQLDVSVYTVDNVDHVAFNNVDRYKHIYYCLSEFGCALPKPILRQPCSIIPTQLIHLDKIDSLCAQDSNTLIIG
uniref:Uncharacterized protein n=1 Tax=Timema bartmani TaxID=61472 RepID=A0A7R9EVG7_9NEOP|nr:unnamed protein product [Timema bartmani]